MTAHRSASAVMTKPSALAGFSALWHDTFAVRIRDFLLLVHDDLVRELPEPLQDHQWRVRWSMLQVYFEHPTVHYEVWVQRKACRIEIGLHFEAVREESYRWARALADRALEIQALLGPRVELEEWTRSWTRLHETRPVTGELTDELAEEVAERLARFVEVLEPILAQERAGVMG
jgi:hypothetical protein